MADWATLGGIGAGLVGAQRQLEDWQQARFLEQQRQRMLKQQQIEDEVQNQIRGIPSSMEVEDRSGVAPDFAGPVQASRTIARPTADITADAAKYMIASGRPELMAKGLGMQSALQQQRASDLAMAEAQYKLNREKAIEDAGNRYRAKYDAISRGEWNHPEVQKWITNFNNQQGAFNDGHTVAPMSSPLGPVMAVYDPQGKVVRQIPMTAQHLAPYLQDAYRAELAYIDPNYAYKNEDVGYKRGHIGVEERKAGVAERGAAVAEGNLALEQGLNPFRKNLMSAQTNYYNDRGQAALAKAEPGTAANKPMKVDLPVFDPSTGKTTKMPILVTTDAEGKQTAKDLAGKPVDQALLDRAMGHASEDQVVNEALGRANAATGKRFETGNLTQSDYFAELAANQKNAQLQRSRLAYQRMNNDGRTNALVEMLNGGTKAEDLVGIGASPMEIKTAQNKVRRDRAEAAELAVGRESSPYVKDMEAKIKKARQDGKGVEALRLQSELNSFRTNGGGQ